MGRSQRTAQVVVAGSGPGGATVARGLARAGKKVIVLEKGRWHRWVGNHLAALGYVDRAGLRRTKEGVGLIRGLTAGGTTVLYCGAATAPPGWFKSDYGIDLDNYLAETIEELDLKPLPDEAVGEAGLRLLEAGEELDHGFKKLRKFIDPRKCRVSCGGTCILGCPHRAKWTARDYLRGMIEAGGELITRAEVERVMVQDGVAIGVVARTADGPVEIKAETVIIAAGGLGTPAILQSSGIDEAGQGMCLDPLVMVSGVSRHQGTCQGPPMSVGTYKYLEEGFILSDVIDPWGFWLIMALMGNPGKIKDFPSYRRQLSLMVKISDERTGSIPVRGPISKPLTGQDRARLKQGADIAREILVRAGCRPESVMVGPVRGAHPMSTAPMGTVVDENLQTRIQNLYVSDASVIPRAMGRPVVLTLICLAKRLTDHLLGRVAEN